MNFPIHIDDLGSLVRQLRSEGFDARTDLFNGQVGLIVGPIGLDPKRMPPDTTGLFFPLWELNYTPNRALVEARRFHDVFENRPTDWKYNHPYQRGADQVRLDLRHWNRSVALLGDKTVEEKLQNDLFRQFPPSEFPVNIDVIGGQHQSFATVQVTNFDAGIGEITKAIPEDFLGAGGIGAAVLAATENIISQLQKTGRMPPTPRQPEAEKAPPLSLRAIGRFGHGPDLSEWDQVFQYEVVGLPPFEQAWIANFGSPYQHEWRVLRATKGVQSDWSGNYGSAESALAALRKDLDTRMRHIETYKGTGVVTSNEGKQVPVSYDLLVYQQEIPAGTMDAPNATVPGLKEIRGRIEPVCFFGESELTLEMQDKRKLLFFFRDMQGSIALNRWIG